MYRAVQHILMNPTGVFEVAVLPFRRDLDEGRFLLFENPVMNKLGTHFCLQHRFDGLKIICEIGTMDVRFLRYANNSTYFSIFALIHHNEWLRYIAFIEIVYLFGNLWRKVLILKATTSGIRIDHQTGIHNCIFVLGKSHNGLLEL